jgi:hypothetical protein
MSAAGLARLALDLGFLAAVAWLLSPWAALAVLVTWVVATIRGHRAGVREATGRKARVLTPTPTGDRLRAKRSRARKGGR